MSPTQAILAADPTVALYVAAILARRLDAANRWLVAVKRQLQTGEPPSVIGKAIEKVEELLSYGGRDPLDGDLRQFGDVAYGSRSARPNPIDCGFLRIRSSSRQCPGSAGPSYSPPCGFPRCLCPVC